MENNKRDYYRHFKNGCLVGCGLVFVLVFLASLIFVFYKFNLFDSFILSSDNLTAKEILSVNTLIKSNKIIMAGDVISHITSFYSVIITILFGGLGLVGFFGYFHIKTLAVEKLNEHRDDVTNAATKKVGEYLKTKEFANTVDKSISEALEGTDVDSINNKIAMLEDKVIQILSSPSTASIENIPDNAGVDAAVPAQIQQPEGGI